MKVESLKFNLDSGESEIFELNNHEFIVWRDESGYHLAPTVKQLLKGDSNDGICVDNKTSGDLDTLVENITPENIPKDWIGTKT